MKKVFEFTVDSHEDMRELGNLMMVLQDLEVWCGRYHIRYYKNNMYNGTMR